MTGFVLLRARAHRLLLAAALLAVLLTTAVLATLAAFSSTVGDAALRRTLAGDAAADAALTLEVPYLTGADREAAGKAVEDNARAAFAGLPVRVQSLDRSGPYELPRRLQPPAARAGEDPDLTHLGALERSEVALTAGRWPGAAAKAPDAGDTSDTRDGGTVQVAVPQIAADRLGLAPGDTLTLAGRSDDDPPLPVEITGVYRPRDREAPYWLADELRGKGVQQGGYTTYGPLLADPGSFASGRVAQAAGAWVLRGDFGEMTAGRADALRASVKKASGALADEPVFDGRAVAATRLPQLLDGTERALLVSRSTLLIVALQLVLLAAYALMLVARLLGAERRGETDLLRARGGSRQRIGVLTAAESLLLALPAAIAAPLLAGPLIRLLSARGPLERAGLTPDSAAGRGTWLVAAACALGCAAAVVAPTLLRGGGDGVLSAGRTVRAKPLPAPLRAGADGALLVVAGVAYWQLDRQTSGSGALSGDRSGTLGIDPVLVAAPALALLAGTVLTLRLLPPVARLAERRAAAGRGLPSALAGWQLSRRPLRGAGPVLLLVLAVAIGMLALAQGASWDRSQRDQADFHAGTDVRVLTSRLPELGQGGMMERVPGVAAAAPAARWGMSLSGGGSAEVLALDTAQAAEGLRLRDDLAAGTGGAELLRKLALGGPVGKQESAPPGPEDKRESAAGAEDAGSGAYATGATGATGGTGAAGGTRHPAAGAERPAGSPPPDARRAETAPADTAAHPAARAERAVGDPDPVNQPASPDQAVPAAARAGGAGAAAPAASAAPAERTRAGGLELPGLPGEVRVVARLDADATARGRAAVTVLVEDRYGAAYELPAGDLPADGRTHTLTADVAAAAGAPDGRPAGPLRLTGLRLVHPQPRDGGERRLDVARIEVAKPIGDEDAATGAREVPLPDGFKWHARAVSEPEALHDEIPAAVADRPRTTGDSALSLNYDTGDQNYDTWTGPPLVTLTVTAARGPTPPLTALATDEMLKSTGAKVGDTISVPVPGGSLSAKITGSVQELPTTGPGSPAAAAEPSRARFGGALLLDLPTANSALTQRGLATLLPSEWWLTTRPGETDTTVAALRDRADTDPGNVLVRDELADALGSDPLGAGPQAALAATAVAAAVLAALGFAVSAAASVRERTREFAVLRALGAPQRQLARTFAAEQGVLIALALAAGMLLGWALARSVIPLITLTGRAAQPVPPVVVELPAGSVAGLLAAVAAVPVLVTVLVALRRGDPATALRLGGE
ncbi:FtsX-like permease family protein [Streptomyces sp. NBC_01808]|uniref:FtsX-like permease family protein n=1 Tax=Streptomyces sp. NBC_01808 TaxID=2975947 RepID=UPI002DDB097F|nr:FtsX-like permease family protein [Streptomyces sp. NBC_01808]WSA37881.1 FtsX-like permease family protein [Streptomyces sp. NBC_01808]